MQRTASPARPPLNSRYAKHGRWRVTFTPACMADHSGLFISTRSARCASSVIKPRALIDWVIELFFPRDIVQTIDLSEMATRDHRPAAREMEHAAVIGH